MKCKVFVTVLSQALILLKGVDWNDCWFWMYNFRTASKIPCAKNGHFVRTELFLPWKCNLPILFTLPQANDAFYTVCTIVIISRSFVTPGGILRPSSRLDSSCKQLSVFNIDFATNLRWKVAETHYWTINDATPPVVILPGNADQYLNSQNTFEVDLGTLSLSTGVVNVLFIG